MDLSKKKEKAQPPEYNNLLNINSNKLAAHIKDLANDDTVLISRAATASLKSEIKVSKLIEELMIYVASDIFEKAKDIHSELLSKKMSENRGDINYQASNSNEGQSLTLIENGSFLTSLCWNNNEYTIVNVSGDVEFMVSFDNKETLIDVSLLKLQDLEKKLNILGSGSVIL